jgi:hypothetical protein
MESGEGVKKVRVGQMEGSERREIGDRRQIIVTD